MRSRRGRVITRRCGLRRNLSSACTKKYEIGFSMMDPSRVYSRHRAVWVHRIRLLKSASFGLRGMSSCCTAPLGPDVIGFSHLDIGLLTDVNRH